MEILNKYVNGKSRNRIPLDNDTLKIVASYVYEIHTELYSNGDVKIIYTTFCDHREGEFKQYSLVGKLHIQCLYIAGKREGEFKEWFDNDRLAIHMYFRNGKYHGPCRIWNIMGDLVEKSNYVDGMEHGITQKWYDGNQPEFECEYSHGVVVGEPKHWDPPRD